MNEYGTSRSGHLVSWAHVAILILAYAGGIGVFFGVQQSGVAQLSDSVRELSHEVRDMGASVGRLASANERLDEHMKSVDRRLDTLEKDKQIETYTHH